LCDGSRWQLPSKKMIKLGRSLRSKPSFLHLARATRLSPFIPQCASLRRSRKRPPSSPAPPRHSPRPGHSSPAPTPPPAASPRPSSRCIGKPESQWVHQQREEAAASAAGPRDSSAATACTAATSHKRACGRCACLHHPCTPIHTAPHLTRTQRTQAWSSAPARPFALASSGRQLPLTARRGRSVATAAGEAGSGSELRPCALHDKAAD
jgi:hypothetical protein